jgi:hypothetical protein
MNAPDEPKVKKRRVQFCPKGHDTFVVGRHKSNSCKACTALQVKATPKEYWRLRQARRRLEDPDYCRKYERRARGVLDATGELKVGPCEVCTRHCDPLQLDHDHTTGLSRGWLCGTCNRALGQAKDNAELLRKLADYLDRTASK